MCSHSLCGTECSANIDCGCLQLKKRRYFDYPPAKCLGGGMRLLFAIIGLLGFSLSATAASEWLYYKEYPWVYDHVSKDWLYLRGATDGNIYAYRNSTKAWEKLVVPDTEWDEKFKIWSQNRELYGG